MISKTGNKYNSFDEKQSSVEWLHSSSACCAREGVK